MATVTLRNVTGGDLQAALDLAIADREMVVLTGPAGSGVSEIVRLIAGLTNVSQGEILFDQQCVNDLPAKDRDVALLSHDYAPYPGMSVEKNLALGLERRNFGATEIRKRIAAVTDTLGLQNELTLHPAALSAAEQRFVGLARVLARQPKVFLFDEPFANLDPTAASRGRAAIAKLRLRSAATIIYATSDSAEALALGARTLVIENGAVLQDAGAQMIFDEPASVSVARFFGQPPINLVQGTLKQERDSLVFSETGDGTIALSLPASRFEGAKGLSGKPVVLGFPPESLEIARRTGDGSGGRTGFRALVDRAEPRGSVSDLYLRTGAHGLICRSRRWKDQSEVGHRFQFEIEVDQAHLFDAVSGRRVTQEL